MASFLTIFYPHFHSARKFPSGRARYVQSAPRTLIAAAFEFNVPKALPQRSHELAALDTASASTEWSSVPKASH
jgi:hypothetical protein